MAQIKRGGEALEGSSVGNITQQLSCWAKSKVA